MIRCRFIFRRRDGGNSDSLDSVHPVSRVPCVGDSLQFVNEDGNCSDHVVVQVLHRIFTDEDRCEVVVFYSGQE